MVTPCGRYGRISPFRAACPRVVRCREVEPGRDPPLEVPVAVELGAVVRGDGPDGARLALHERFEPRVQIGGRASARACR